MITPEDQKQFRNTRLIAIAELIIAPLIYLVIAYTNSQDIFEAPESTKLIMYLLIPIAAIGPLAWLLIKPIQIGIRKRSAADRSRAKTYFTLMLNKLSLVAAIYIYGLVVFFLTNDMMNMTWFYLIGIVWSVIYWPRRSHFERVMKDGLEAI